MEFTVEQKYKIWIDYIITQATINNYPYEFDMNYNPPDQSGLKTYPILGVKVLTPSKHKSFQKIRYKSFDDFCKDLKDERIADYYWGWYWRFKNRIKL